MPLAMVVAVTVTARAVVILVLDRNFLVKDFYACEYADRGAIRAWIPCLHFGSDDVEAASARSVTVSTHAKRILEKKM